MDWTGPPLTVRPRPLSGGLPAALSGEASPLPGEVDALRFPARSYFDGASPLRGLGPRGFAADGRVLGRRRNPGRRRHIWQHDHIRACQVPSIFQDVAQVGAGLVAPRILKRMATQVSWSAEGSSLVSVKVYMHPAQRQRLREQAARRGVAMSEYIKILIDEAHRGFGEVE